MGSMYDYLDYTNVILDDKKYHAGFGRIRMRKAITGELPHTGEREKARRLKQMKKANVDV